MFSRGRRKLKLLLERSRCSRSGWSGQLIEAEFEITPSVTNTERGVRNLELVLRQMHTAFVAGIKPHDIVANSRKKTMEAWRRLQERVDLTIG